MKVVIEIVIEIAIIAVSYLLIKSLTYKYANPEAVFMCGWLAGAIIQDIIKGLFYE